MHIPQNYEYAANHVLIPAIVMFFLVWGLVGAAVGMGLIVSSARSFRVFGLLNHYVSTRHGMKQMAMPRDIGPSVRRHRRLIAALLVPGALFSIYGLLVRFDAAAIVSTLALDYPPALVSWIVDSARWSLIVFNVLALVVAIMIGTFPDALGKIEAGANRWISGRKLAYGAETMHLSFDRLVEAFPRSTGCIIVIAASYVAVNAAIIWAHSPR